jgi:hypothetical protein
LQKIFMSKKFYLAAILTAASLFGYAQQDSLRASKTRIYGDVFVHVSLPVGDFGDENIGAAGTGLGFGGMGFKPLGDNILYLSFLTSCAVHSFNVPDALANIIGDDDIGRYHVWNVLLGLGIRDNNSDINFYANALFGFHYTILTGLVGRSGYEDGLTYTYSLGAGVVAFKILMGIRYAYANPYFRNLSSDSWSTYQKIEQVMIMTGYEF